MENLGKLKFKKKSNKDWEKNQTNYRTVDLKNQTVSEQKSVR